MATSAALIAFAANSVLCRLALGQDLIDAASFTALRLFSGAMMLGLMVLLMRYRQRSSKEYTAKHASPVGTWLDAVLLFIYAASFSLAYVSLDTGTGALVLFAAVQLTMIGTAVLWYHERLHCGEWLGLGIAFAGFVYLILPGVSAPSLSGLLLMSFSGVAWGMYTMRGRSSRRPLMDTAGNFIRSLPFACLLLLVAAPFGDLSLSPEGILLAILSGALASGVGYAIWYLALAGLSASTAAASQLLVPVIAAMGGVVFVSEPMSARFMIAAILILGGIALIVWRKQQAMAEKAA